MGMTGTMAGAGHAEGSRPGPVQPGLEGGGGGSEGFPGGLRSQSETIRASPPFFSSESQTGKHISKVQCIAWGLSVPWETVSANSQDAPTLHGWIQTHIVTSSSDGPREHVSGGGSAIVPRSANLDLGARPTCVSQLCVAVTKITDKDNLKEEKFILGSQFQKASQWLVNSIVLGPQ